MKKIAVFISVICLLVCSLSTVNAGGNTPWDAQGVNVHIYQDFSSFGNMNIMQFTEGFTLESTGMTHFMRIKNNRLDFYTGGGGDMYFTWSLPSSAPSKSQFAKAEGIGFYVENNTPGEIIIGFQTKNADNVQYICSSFVYMFDLETGDFYIGDTDDSWDVHCMPIIPAYFKGYVVFPIDSITTREGVAWSSSDYLDSLGLILRGGVLNEKNGENMIIDNLFIYGKNVADNNNGRVVFNAGDVPADDVVPTATATVKPSATTAPTTVPTAVPTDKTTTEVTTAAPVQSTVPQNSASTDITSNPTEGSSMLPETTTLSPQPQSGSNLLWVYIMMGVVFVGGVIVIVVVLSKKN